MKSSLRKFLIRALRGRAEVFNLVGEFRKGIADYRAIISRLQRGGRSESAMVSQCRFDIAYILAEGFNDFERAERTAREELQNMRKGDAPLAYAHGLHVLGEIAQHRGAYDEALRYHTESLSVAKKRKAIDFSGILANSIGNTYGLKGDYYRSTEYFNKSIDICNSRGNKRGKAASLCNLGTVLLEKGELDAALRHFKEFHSISVDIGDKKAVSLASNNIGVIHHMMGDIERAIPYYKKHLVISEEIGYRRGIASVSVNLGGIHMYQGMLGKALEYFRRAYVLFKQLGDRRSVGVVVNNLGLACMLKGEFGIALRHFKERIRLSEEMADKRGLANSYDNIGVVYIERGRFSEAKQFLDKAKDYLLGIGDKGMLAQINVDFSRFYYAQKQCGKAATYAQNGVGLAREAKLKPKLAMALRALGLALAAQDPQKAIMHLDESSTIAKKEGLRFEYAKSRFALACVYRQCGKTKSAKEELKIAMKIFREGGATYWYEKAKQIQANL